MLDLRADQMESLLDSRLRLFEDQMVEHLWRHFPRALAGKSEDELRELVRAGILGAKRHGATQPQALCRFVDLTVAFGEGFDRSSDYPWAEHLLQDDSIPDPNVRIAELARVAVEYLQGLGEQDAPTR